MKKIITILTVYFLTTNILFAEEKKCAGIKKLSKEYLVCTAKNIKEGAAKKTEQIKDGTKKIGNKIKSKIKKKE